MNLPLVLDIVISLGFIYLILSLLASEIQELVTTVLQWRARHLRDSIENLLSGAGSTVDQQKAQFLVKAIYDDPLIRNLNQQVVKGVAARGFRLLSQWLFSGNKEGAFGSDQSSGPSYISPDSFATALLERFGLASLLDKLVESRLDQFVERIIGDVTVTETSVVLKDATNPTGLWTIAQNCGVDLSNDRAFRHLVEDFRDVQNDFYTDHITVEICLDRLSESLDRFFESYPDSKSDNVAYFLDRAFAFKLGLFGKNNERAVLSAGLQPTLSDISALIDKGSIVYKQVAHRYEAMATQAAAITEQIDRRTAELLEQRSGLDATTMTQHTPTDDDLKACRDQAISELDPKSLQVYNDYQAYQRAAHALDHLPPSMKDSMTVLARRAETRVQDTVNSVHVFQQEVAQWFDHSMERASGVYKRNAKGVAIVIGVLIAMVTNSDTFHMVNRLSSDESLRKIIVDQASQIKPQDQTPAAAQQTLEALKSQTEEVLLNIPLPLSWNASNLSRQLGCAVPVNPASQPSISPSKQTYNTLTQQQWNDIYRACLNLDPQAPVPQESVPVQVTQMIVAKPMGFLRMMAGWLVSGFAISMGAPFWFDLLGKLVNVRNTGGKPKPPEAPSEDSSSS